MGGLTVTTEDASIPTECFHVSINELFKPHV